MSGDREEGGGRRVPQGMRWYGGGGGGGGGEERGGGEGPMEVGRGGGVGVDDLHLLHLTVDVREGGVGMGGMGGAVGEVLGGMAESIGVGG